MNIKTFKYNSLLLVTVGMIVFFSVSKTDAAVISLSSDKEVISSDELVKVDVLIDSENETINAISGSIIFDANTLHPEKIISGNSLITFWVEKPVIQEESKNISFSGIIPGGITARDGYLFSIIFSGTQKGVSDIKVSAPTVLLNDGDGTMVATTNRSTTVTTTDIKTTSTDTYIIIDTVPPDQFTITRNQDQSLFNNNWFIVFSTQDKGSGIDHYNVCELLFKKCEQVDSPYELQNQSNWYITMVRAYDTNENVRISLIISKNIKIVFASIVLSSILIVIYGFLSRKKKFSR